MSRSVVCLLLALVFCACGRPATVQECEEIASRVAVLEFEAEAKAKSATPPTPEQVQVIRARVHDAMMKGCVGKRITERALKCVRKAKTADAIKKDCFD